MTKYRFTLCDRGIPRRRTLTALLALLAGLAVAPQLTARPRVPTDDHEVIERLPSRSIFGKGSELAALRAAAARNPTDVAAAVALAEHYFDLALAQGDPRYVGYAEAALKRVGDATSAPRLAMRGQLRQYRHDFAGALGDFDAALKLDPQLAEAHAWRGAIFLVQADYDAARRECDDLRRLARPVLHAGCEGLRLAYVGQSEAAVRTLEAGLAEAALPESRLWLLTRLGEVAAWRGQAALAERHYRAALQLGLDDTYLLAAWSDFLLDQRRPDEVVQLLGKWTAVDALLLRLAEAESALKLSTAAEHIRALGERFDAATQRGDTTHRAEEARYHLRLRGDPARALAPARDNYAEQREPRDARVLLECAVAARDPAAAQPALAWLRSSGFQDDSLQRLAEAAAVRR